MSALVIDGHPNPDSLTASLARAYADGHGDARVLALRELDFDVHLRLGYRGRMPIEPDLAEAREAIRASTRVVVATPLWWGGTPALLKGFFDRALLPGEDYTHDARGLPVGLLRGRTGRVLITSDTPSALMPVLGLSAVDQVARRTLAFCGLAPVRVSRFSGVRGSTPAQRDAWLERARRVGACDAAADARRTSRAEPALARG